MKKILFFDTETTGLPINYKASVSDVDNWPRMIQLAISVYVDSDAVGPQKISSKEFLIKPDGWEIPKLKFWIENGFTQEKSISEGVPVRDAILYFIEQSKNVDLMVAHNMSFDSKILGAEMVRLKMGGGNSPKFCTMTSTIQFCKLPFPKGGEGFKFPKLEELYKILFDRDFKGAHQAGSDTEGCAECYFELLRRGII